MGRKASAIAALIVFFSVLPARAQSRGGGMRGGVMRAPVSTRTMRGTPMVVRPRATSRSSSVVVTSPFSTFGGNTFFTGDTFLDAFGFPVPGLGFDFPHLAAVNGNLGVRALIDPATRAQIALALRLRGINSGFFSPFFFGGGFPIAMETPGLVAQQPEAAPQAPVVVVVPPAAQPAPPAAAVVDQPPLPDPGEFVLVQRDGRLLFAVAFTAQPGHVVYVTKEGLRRSIALDQLDVDTTLRMNEERGSSIQIPRV